MSRPKNVSNRKLFDRDPMYVITPVYDTREELDEHIQKLMQGAKQRGYSNGRIPQRVFLQLLGMRQPIGSREYKNDVLLDTGQRCYVKSTTDKITGYYARFDIEKTTRSITEREDLIVRHDLNTYTG